MENKINETTEEILARLMKHHELTPDALRDLDGYEWYEILNAAVYELPENEFLLLLHLAVEYTCSFWRCYPDILWDIRSRYSLDTVIAAAKLAGSSGYLFPVEGEAFPCMAAGWGDPELLRRLVEEVGVSVNSYCESDIIESTGSMLSISAREGCFENCVYLLDKGADPNEELLADLTSPLVEAVVNNRLEVAHLLLERGASQQNLSYCYEIFIPVEYARENGHQDMVKLLEGYLES